MHGAEGHADRPIITNPGDVWALPPAAKDDVHRLRIEGRVNYVDLNWGLFWLERDGLGTYLQLSSAPPEIKTGQYVIIEGTIIPNKGLRADEVTVTVVNDYVPVEPIPTVGRISDIVELNNRIVELDAYVDDQQLIDNEHLRLYLIVEDRPVICWIKPDSPENLPDWRGDFIRLTGMYSGRFDPTGNKTMIEIWSDKQANMEVIGSIDDSPLFAIHETPINQVYIADSEENILIRGVVRSQDPGSSLIVRSDDGEIVVQSVQRRRVPLGVPIEVVGRKAVLGASWRLESALYRRMAVEANRGDPTSEMDGVITNIDHIRKLSLREAAQQKPVKISGVVTWASPDADFFFLFDVSGGLRVSFDRSKMQAPLIGKYLLIEGTTCNGGFAPYVHLDQFTDLGSMTSPEPIPITFDQAITGQEDGQWVELHGFLRQVDSDGDWRWMHVTTPSGEFVAMINSTVNVVATPGSLIHVRGALETTVDESGRIKGLLLRVPFLHDISVAENAPSDLFDLPLRSIDGLRQLSAVNGMSRARIAGTVVHHEPGHHLTIEDGESGLLVLSRGTAPLQPGNEVEVVGIIGRQGVRTILREAVFRKLSDGAPPPPTPLEDIANVQPEMDERLVSVRGTLIETLTRTNSTRLTLQAENTVFEAVLSHSAADRDVLDLTPDMGLELTGIYGIDFDDSRHARGFQLRLRSPEDVTIYRKPPAWTIQRAFAVSGILGGFTILGIAWVTALRRRVNRQTEQIRSQLEKEVAFQERHRGIVEHASDFIFTTDLEGNFTSFNTAGERMTGIPRKKAQQMNIRELLNKDGADKLLNAGSLPQDDGVITFQSRLRSRNKGLIWTETNARLLRDGDRPVEILGIVRDISERKQIEGELQRARDAAEATTKAKGEFLANMSHEIRTPMNAVIGMSNLLMDTGLNEHQKDYAQTIRNGAESLLTVLNDILDFSKIEAGQLHFEHLDFDLRETIKGVIELLSPKAIAKHLDLRSEIPHSVPCKLRGDPSRLRQVLMNLVGNAIKFTEVGEVSVSVALESESDTGVRLLFDVTDTGIGIPLEAQPRLFRPFSQADGSTTRKFGGTGLGLAISKQIVELMGGSCAVRSKPGEGATFWFNAPFAKQTAATKSDGKDSERPAQNSQPVRSLHVLLAEDNLVNQRVAALQLKKLGHQIDTASNGIEVLNALQSKSYDVIIMDCQMPEMDGYEAARQIREGSIANRIPIIALTANAMQGDREKCIEAGMDDYLSKPMRLPDLQDALRRCANKTTGSGTSPNDVSGGDPAKVHARGPDQS